MNKLGQFRPISLNVQQDRAADVFLRRLRRRWLLAALLGCATFAAAATIILRLPPQYSTEGTIILEERQSRVVGFEQVLPRLSGDAESVQSEVEVLRSRSLLQKTIDSLRLSEVQEFNHYLESGTPIGRLTTWLKEFELLLLGEAQTKQPTPAEVRAKAITELQARLSVVPVLAPSRVVTSRVIKISLTGSDPVLTAAIVNAHMRSYIDTQLEAKLAAIRGARTFLAAQASEMREKVRRAEAAVEEFRGRAGLLQGMVQGTSTLLIRQDLADATAELNSANSRRELAEARLEQVGNRQRRLTLPEVVSNPLIVRLRDQQALLQQSASQAEETFGPRHTKVLQLRVALVDLDKRINQEVDKIAESLWSEAQVYRQHEAAARARFENLKKKLAQGDEAGVQLAALSREADAARGLLSALLTREQEVSASEALQQPDARVLSSAEPPLRPASPRKFLLFAVGAAASVVVGASAGFLPDRRRRSFVSSVEIENELGLPVASMIPAVPARYLTADPSTQPPSIYCEAIRDVWPALSMRDDMCPRALLITSSVPGEGKSTFTMSLAHSLAKEGRRVVVVDFDLRRASLTARLGLQDLPGLVTVLAEGRAATLYLIKGRSGISVLPSGGHDDDPHRLIVADRIRLLLADLKAAYDVVLLDAPPTLAVADTGVAAKLVDSVLYLVQWGRTPRAAVSAGLHRLQAAGASVASVVMTQVDLREHQEYGFTDPASYRWQYQRYYVR